MDADDNVKICDFGFARFTQKNQYLETFCGSLSYSAPGKDLFMSLCLNLLFIEYFLYTEVILRKKYTGPGMVTQLNTKESFFI